MKKALSLLLASAVLVSLFSACGGSPEKEAAKTDAKEESSAATNEAPAAEGTKDDRVLKIRLSTSLASTDWEQNTTTADCQVIWTNVFEGLYGINESKGGYYKELAKDVQLSDDQLTYSITLQDATFQNGDPVTGADVEYSYTRAMANERWNYLTNMIASVKATGDKTVDVTLKYPYSPIDHTFFSVKIVNQKEIEAQGDKFGTLPHKAGTGPYYVSEYNPASGVKLTAYEGYWRGVADVKNVEYVVITEDSAAVIAYENGDISYLHDAPTAEWEALSKKAGDHCAMLKGNSIRMLTINWESKNNNGILANELVRKAIFYAVNKETLNQAATNGYGVVTSEYMPSEYVSTSPKAADGGFELYPYNPEKAKELLRQAGFTDEQLAAGVPIGTLSTYGSATGEKAKQAQVIQANLAEIGLKCEVEVADVSIISPRLHSYDYDLSIYGDSGNFDYNNIRQQTHSESVGMDVVHFNRDNSPFNWQRIEELIDLGVATSDVPTRVKYYTELWKIVQDSATILPLIHMPVGICWSEQLDPVDLCPTYYHIYSFKWVS